MKFLYSKQKLTIEELIFFEKEINLKLPQDYKKLILEYNGGTPEKEYFRGKWVIFDSIKYGKNPIEDNLKSFKSILPKKLYPFGHDPGGWLFCLDLNEGEDYGKVYFYRMDENTAEDSKEFLANSFQEFLENLSDNEDY